MARSGPHTSAHSCASRTLTRGRSERAWPGALRTEGPKRGGQLLPSHAEGGHADKVDRPLPLPLCAVSTASAGPGTSRWSITGAVMIVLAHVSIYVHVPPPRLPAAIVTEPPSRGTAASRAPQAVSVLWGLGRGHPEPGMGERADRWLTTCVARPRKGLPSPFHRASGRSPPGKVCSRRGRGQDAGKRASVPGSSCRRASPRRWLSPVLGLGRGDAAAGSAGSRACSGGTLGAPGGGRR